MEQKCLGDCAGIPVTVEEDEAMSEISNKITIELDGEVMADFIKKTILEATKAGEPVVHKMGITETGGGKVKDIKEQIAVLKEMIPKIEKDAKEEAALMREICEAILNFNERIEKIEKWLIPESRERMLTHPIMEKWEEKCRKRGVDVSMDLTAWFSLLAALEEGFGEMGKE